MSSEYLTETYYAHPQGEISVVDDGKEGTMNLYGLASFLVTCGYIDHRNTTDNGDAPRSRVKELLGDWLSEDKERNLYLGHIPTLRAVTEAIADRLYQSI
jgi:hypothetical protein